MLSLSQEDKELLNRLNRRPDLKKRMKSILCIAEDDGEGIVKADEAEPSRKSAVWAMRCLPNGR